MNLVEIPSADFKAEIPSHWDEMNAVQVEFCSKQAILASIGLIIPLEAKVRCLYHLLDIERDWKTEVWEQTVSKGTVQEKNSKIVILAEQLCSFIFKEVPADKQADPGGSSVSGLPSSVLEVNYNTLTNHFPAIRIGKQLLHGPGDLLTGMTFGEFRTATVHMQAYFESKNQEELSRMIACLYRVAPADLEAQKKSNAWNGQRRVAFNPDRMEEYSQLTARLSVVQRNIILLWFTFCIDYIKTKTIPINGVDVEFSILFEGSGSSGPGTGWSGVLYGVAEKKIFGDADQVDQREFLEVLFFLYDKELENRRIKSKLKTKSK